MRVKRAGLTGLLIAACLGQACFLIENCDQTPTVVPTPPPNAPPAISDFTVTPREIIVGGRVADVSARIIDDAGRVGWSLTVAADSQATGTFAPREGFDGSVSSKFSPAPTSSGTAKLTLTAFDFQGGTTEATVTVFVVAPTRR